MQFDSHAFVREPSAAEASPIRMPRKLPTAPTWWSPPLGSGRDVLDPGEAGAGEENSGGEAQRARQGAEQDVQRLAAYARTECQPQYRQRRQQPRRRPGRSETCGDFALEVALVAQRAAHPVQDVCLRGASPL